MALSKKHQQFVNEYLKCWNATMAYRLVYPKASEESARRLGSNLLTRHDVSFLIQSRIGENANDVNVMLSSGLISRITSNRQQSSYVYVIRSENGLFKIGISNNPLKRLKTLDTASPVSLKLYAMCSPVDAFAVEQELHEKFTEYNVKGEWFFIPKTILANMIDQYGFVLSGE